MFWEVPAEITFFSIQIKTLNNVEKQFISSCKDPGRQGQIYCKHQKSQIPYPQGEIWLKQGTIFLAGDVLVQNYLGMSGSQMRLSGGSR